MGNYRLRVIESQRQCSRRFQSLGACRALLAAAQPADHKKRWSTPRWASALDWIFVSPPSEVQVGPLSYTRGADVPLLEITLSEALSLTAARFPDRDGLIVCHQNIRLTWQDLDREVTRVARGLAGLGLQPGDRVGIWASNCVEWVLMQYATARAGIILVNVNPANRSHELRYVLKHSRIRALVLRAQDSRADYRQILGESRNGSSLPLEHEIWLGEESW